MDVDVAMTAPLSNTAKRWMTAIVLAGVAVLCTIGWLAWRRTMPGPTTPGTASAPDETQAAQAPEEAQAPPAPAVAPVPVPKPQPPGVPALRAPAIIPTDSDGKPARRTDPRARARLLERLRPAVGWVGGPADTATRPGQP